MWENKIIRQDCSIYGGDTGHLDQLQNRFVEKLNQLGLDGWEVTSVCERHYPQGSAGTAARSWTAFLKRWVAD